MFAGKETSTREMIDERARVAPRDVHAFVRSGVIVPLDRDAVRGVLARETGERREAPRPDVLQLRTFNYRRGRPDFLMTMQVLVITPGVTLEKVGNALAAEAGAGRDEPITWKTLEGSPRRIISRSFQMGSSTTHPMDVRVGLVQLSEREVAMVAIMAGEPPSAVEMLERFHLIRGLDSLEEEVWKPWLAWFVDIEESHTSFAGLPFFRSPQPDRSWITAAGVVLDAAAIYASSLDVPRSPAAELSMRSG